MRSSDRVAQAKSGLGSMWDGSGMTLAAGTWMRTWLEQATRLQSETAAFWSARAAKDMAAMATLARCTDPAQAFEAQMQYVRDAMSDWAGESWRLMQLAQDATAGALAKQPGGETAAKAAAQ